MADETQLFCRQCSHNVLATRKSTSHIFHLIMTIFTAGLWLLVWLGSSIKTGGWRCSRCGGTKLSSAKG